MESLEAARIIIGIIGAVASFLFVVVIPTTIKLEKTMKNYKAAKEAAAEAKTEAERNAAEAEAEKIKNELLGMATSLVQSAENTYKEVDAILKTKTSKGCGAVKKDSVMTKLQAACIEKGVDFDEEYWSAKIDELVKLTREVNTKGA